MKDYKDDLFYVRAMSEGYSGNSVFWWGENGYVIDLNKAKLFSYESAMSIFNNRSSDKPYRQSDVLKATVVSVDSQYLQVEKNDEFYLELRKLENEKNEKDKELLRIKKDKELLEIENNYKENELFSLLENLFLNKDYIDNFVDFSTIYKKATDNFDDFSEYFFPTLYNKTNEEVFKDLIKYKFLIKCDVCNKYYACFSFDTKVINNGIICDNCLDSYNHTKEKQVLDLTTLEKRLS